VNRGNRECAIALWTDVERATVDAMRVTYPGQPGHDPIAYPISTFGAFKIIGEIRAIVANERAGGSS
jgi:hypothetical protein